MGRIQVSLNINGRIERLEIAPHRPFGGHPEDLQLTGTKCGCEDGTCGACTVLLNGRRAFLFTSRSGSPRARDCHDRGIVRRREAAPGTGGICQIRWHSMWVLHPGHDTSAKALLDKNPSPTEWEVRQAISGNLCRCTGYTKIVESVMALSGQRAHPCQRKVQFQTIP